MLKSDIEIESDSESDGSKHATGPDPSTPPRKKARRLVHYRRDWEADFHWLQPVRDDVYKAHCTICKKIFSIAHSGKGDVKQHSTKECHVKANSATSSKQIDNFFTRSTSTPTAIDLKVSNQ
jgi:hypothetical protein